MIRSYFLGGNGSERYLISFKISNHELKFDINHNNELYGLTIFNEGSIIETYHINKLSDVDLDFSNLDKLNEQIEILEILK